MSETELPVAATVVLVRDATTGPEVLLLRRPDRGSFAGAWVFPGGRLEDADSAAAGADAIQEHIARHAARREIGEETGLELALDSLLTFSCWVPPQHAAPRIRTWFFLAPAPSGDVTPQEGEVEEHLWLAPAEALRRHGRGELQLYPPTWVTLHELSEPANAASLLSGASVAGIRHFETIFHPDSRSLLLWSQDADYGPGRTPTARHRLDTAVLPWVYTHGDLRWRP